MLFKVHQHEAPGEQFVERGTPALLVRKDLVSVAEHELVGLGADQGNARCSKDMAAVDVSVCADHSIGERVRVFE